MSRMVWGQLNKERILAERNSSSTNRSTKQKSITDYPSSNSVVQTKREVLDVDSDEVTIVSSSPVPFSTTLREDSVQLLNQRKRSREARTEFPAQVLPDDSVSWGPSGSDRRGVERPVRRLVASVENPAFRESRSSSIPTVFPKTETSLAMSSSNSNTDFDECLLAPFFGDVPPPRDVFRGCVFFLNSCDSDPLISAYLLEKLIRRLGGHTSMGVNGLVNYVVAQHLSSAKERKKGGGNAVYVHPHFILACAREGKKVSHKSFLTNVRVDKS
jgi:hypothetical protein